jgi:uncharacterized membrane protein YoaK (UPF0700 family)
MEAIALATIAGYVDGYALRVFGTFVSFMSGNTTQTGVGVGQGQFAAALTPALSIAGFLGGSFAGNWIAHSRVRSFQRLLFTAAAVLIACFILLNLHTPLNANLGIPILSLAMGMMNPTVSRVGSEPVSLTFVTGTLNKIGNHLALGVRHAPLPDAQGVNDTHFRRALLEASVWAGFLAGAILSGVASHYVGVVALAPASIVLIAFALMNRAEAAVPSRQD